VSAPEPRLPAPGPETCPLCGATVAPGDERCPDCNMTLAGVGARPQPFDRRAVWWWAAALVAIYLVVLAIVVVAR
jgi:predicted amidophosphoribosyltransferase